MALKRALTTTTRLDLGDGDWVEVRNALSKGQRNLMAAYFPDRFVREEGNAPVDPETGEPEKPKLSAKEAVALQVGVFQTLVTGWSAEQPCTVEEYLLLDAASTDKLDQVLAEHYKTLQQSPEEAKAEAKAAFRDGGEPLEGAAD